MPFIEIYGFETSAETKARLAGTATEAVSGAYGIDPAIVTVYMIDFADEHYAHAGRSGTSGAQKRMFVKLFALPRSIEMKRAVVRRLTDAVAKACDFPPENIAVYIFQSDKDDVAHGGLLQSDAQA